MYIYIFFFLFYLLSFLCFVFSSLLSFFLRLAGSFSSRCSYVWNEKKKKNIYKLGIKKQLMRVFADLRVSLTWVTPHCLALSFHFLFRQASSCNWGQNVFTMIDFAQCADFVLMFPTLLKDDQVQPSVWECERNLQEVVFARAPAFVYTKWLL